MHECPICGYECDCDGEDMSQPAPDDCRCALADAAADMDGTGCEFCGHLDCECDDADNDPERQMS